MPRPSTTSAGLARALGAADGDRLDRDRALEALARVAAAVRAVLAAGAVGVDIEDARHTAHGEPLWAAEQAERNAAAREAADEAGVPLLVDARIDTFLRGAGGVDRTPERAAASWPGADGIFVPGAVAPETVGGARRGHRRAPRCDAGPGAPPAAEPAALGVARISAGSRTRPGRSRPGPPRRAGAARGGTYGAPADGYDHGELNTLFTRA
ncbi:isocitrate lyase/phosphoenolpyruvate mutase family protein [Streptomyces sp. NPDC052301]|uniref:isocitrate lyase/phosphoenolpyruvate mutase family protein n=1 Tax=Streptomyces sp. NPDC052301 TaxID=3365687 RepID=UPI0037D6BD16